MNADMLYCSECELQANRRTFSLFTSSYHSKSTVQALPNVANNMSNVNLKSQLLFQSMIFSRAAFISQEDNVILLCLDRCFCLVSSCAFPPSLSSPDLLLCVGDEVTPSIYVCVFLQHRSLLTQILVVCKRRKRIISCAFNKWKCTSFTYKIKTALCFWIFY